MDDRERTEVQRLAAEHIARNIAQVERLLAECSRIADEHKIDFKYNGPVAGAGGYYSTGEWNPSSMDC
jgi:hypothetical protein